MKRTMLAVALTSFMLTAVVPLPVQADSTPSLAPLSGAERVTTACKGLLAAGVSSVDQLSVTVPTSSGSDMTKATAPAGSSMTKAPAPVETVSKAPASPPAPQPPVAPTAPTAQLAPVAPVGPSAQPGGLCVGFAAAVQKHRAEAQRLMEKPHGSE